MLLQPTVDSNNSDDDDWADLSSESPDADGEAGSGYRRQTVHPTK